MCVYGWLIVIGFAIGAVEFVLEWMKQNREDRSED